MDRVSQQGQTEQRPQDMEATGMSKEHVNAKG